MTDEQINKAIAEACGWWGNCKENCMRPPNCTDMYCEIPDYCKDLNAMHEAEKMLHQQQCRDYADNLANSTQDGTWASCHMWHHSASQRAEAFLKTLNLWKQ